MYKSIKKITSVVLAATIFMMLMTINIVSNAAEVESQVRVIIRNDTYSVASGASWDGILIDEWVDINNNSTMMSAVMDVLEENNYEQTGAEYNYISSINNLSAGDGGYMSGWLGTLNDWFTNQGFGAYTVADGTLEAGDEICIAYSCNYGEDIGCMWSSMSTALNNISFSSGAIQPEFNSEITEYQLILPYDTTEIVVTPTAVNKNFQVRTYLNDYTPNVDNSEYKRNEAIPVANGDKIIIGVGDNNWPSMNGNTESTVYSFEIILEDKPQSLGKVNVKITNDVFSIEDGSAWEGTLIDEWVDIYEDSTMISAILTALDNHGYSQKGADSGAFTEINGLSTGDASYMSGWMGTLNDWFTNQGFSYYTVADGTLEAGDEISLEYTDAWGMDIGSYWDDNTTALAYLEFEGGFLTQDFDPEITEYTLKVPASANEISVIPTAWNRNYQVRTYLNDYVTTEKGLKKSTPISVVDGDVIYVGVGEPEWPSMSYSSDGTVYKINVEYIANEFDVNFDGITSVDDVTEMQKYLAGFIEFSDEAITLADVNGDGDVTIDDVTALQMILLY